MRWWVKLILGLAAIALMALFAVRVGKLTLNVLQNAPEENGAHDPMFADGPEPTSTIPPELSGETDGRVYEDNSANWDTSVQTPVDRTADELAEDARAASEDR